MYDLLIKNACIIDGSGKPQYIGDVASVNGKLLVSTVDSSLGAKRVIDGTGLTLTPGFIDSHSHIDEAMYGDPNIYELCKINQGITTEVCGQCGASLFPYNKKFEKEHETIMKSFVDDGYMKLVPDFVDFPSFLVHAKSMPKGQNFYFNVGHGSLRAAAMGTENRKPTASELELMKEMLQDAMEHGCVGMTSGLIYNPGVFSETEELIELCKVMAPYGGVYATHMRNEAGSILDAVAEAIKIAETAGVKLVISHHKVCGKGNWGLATETLRLVHEAVERGVDITLDQYPYEATQTYMNVILPPKYFAMGMDYILENLADPVFRATLKAEITDPASTYENQWKNCGGFSGIMILSSPNVPEACGMRVSEYAEKIGKDDFDTYFDLLIANKGAGLCAYFCIDEKEIQQIYTDEYTVPGTDCIITLDDSPCHPRTYGSFVRTIAHFEKECKLLPLEEVIYKQTFKTAKTWGIPNKGLIKDGYDSDLVLFDYETIYDTPSFENGRQLCEGIKEVIVNGEVVYEDKKLTGTYSGKCLLRGGIIA